MYYLRLFATLIALLAVVASSAAQSSLSAKTNLVVYYGSAGGQLTLAHHCNKTDIDYISIGFLNKFPAQADGYPGSNYGNQCWASVYSGPGYHGTVDHSKDAWYDTCQNIARDIPYCKSIGKKILVALGGGGTTWNPPVYQLTGTTDGEYFADLLWAAFGPLQSGNTIPRPFDYYYPGTTVDGFDFDIEVASTDNSVGYVALLKRLRSHFPAGSSYIITGAPQCVLDDVMATMINGAQFDALFIQFYNNPDCSARNWITNNPNYASTGVESVGGFTFDAWANKLVGGASQNAKIFIGLLASSDATSSSMSTQYITPSEVSTILTAYYCRPKFAGVMLYDATYADNNVDSNNVPFDILVKRSLIANSVNTKLSCVTATISTFTGSSTTSTSSVKSTSTSSSTTSSRSSTSKTSGSTLTTSSSILSTRSISTSMSTKTSSSSSSQTSGRTSSMSNSTPSPISGSSSTSKTQSIALTSTSGSKLSSSSSSSTNTTSSKTSIITSSTTATSTSSTTPTSTSSLKTSSITSSKTSSSTSASVTRSTSSSLTSGSKSSTFTTLTGTSSSSAPSQSSIMGFYQLGCYTDPSNGEYNGHSMPLLLVNSTGMTVEMCISVALAKLPQTTIKFVGLEYGSECYGKTSQPLPEPTSLVGSKACTNVCAGNSGEKCGGSGVINVWGSGVTSGASIYSTPPATSLTGTAAPSK